MKHITHNQILKWYRQAWYRQATWVPGTRSVPWGGPCRWYWYNSSRLY